MSKFKFKLLNQIVVTAIVMLWFSLAIGVFYREFTKFMLKGVSLGHSLLPFEFIKFAHGHALTLGFLVPIGLAFMVFLLDDVEESTYKRLCAAFWLYLAGALGAVILLLWKGIDYVRFYAHNSSMTVDEIETMLFFGSKALRASLYGIFHLAFGIGLVWFTLLIWKLLSQNKEVNHGKI